MIKVILIDDHTIIRIGLKKIFDNYPDFQIIGDFGLPLPTIQKLNDLQPDIILCDIAMPNVNGFEYIKKIKQQYPQLKIAVLTMYKEESYISQAIQVGVDGYFHKDVSEQNLTEGIQKICSGEKYYSQEISQVVINRLLNKSGEYTINPVDLLSPREIEVIRLLYDGLNNREIAEKLFISPKTVDNHRANILQKLDLKNNVQLVKFAIEHKLV
jgi:two-component system, NarL family, response regulator NreC